MKNYPTVRIRDVAQFLKGKKPSITYDKVTNNAVPHILIENFGGRYTSYTDDQGCVHCERNDTIIVADGASTGLVSTNHEGCIGSTLGALRPRQSKINPRYLYFFTQSNFTTLNSRTRGAAIPHIERELLLNLEFTLPPLVEQERIVRLLDEADALRRLRREADELTNKVIASSYNNLFLRSSARRSWNISAIETLTNKKDGAIRTGPFGSQLLHSEFVNKGVPVLGIDNVVENEFRWTTSRCIPREKFNKFLRFQVFPGDVMVTIMGTVGKCCVAPDDLPLCMSTKHLCIITPDRDLIHPIYLWAALLYDPDVHQQTRAVGGGAIMEGWNSTIIKQLKLHIPPIALQHEFASHVAEIRKLQTSQATSRSRLDELFQSLRNRAYQGAL